MTLAFYKLACSRILKLKIYKHAYSCNQNILRSKDLADCGWDPAKCGWDLAECLV